MGAESLAGLTLLVVEDNEIAREGVAAVLRREGCAAVLAVDGEQALACLRSGPVPDLILLDMMMPRVDGWKLLGELRKDPALAAVPTVVMTGLSIASREWAESLGAVGVLHKPLETEALLREVRRCCRR